MKNSKRKVIKSSEIDKEISLEDRLNLEENVYLEDAKPAKIVRSNKNADSQTTQGILEKAQQEATKIKQHAKKIYLEVEKRVKEAEAKGYEDGKEEGIQALTDLAIRMQKRNQAMMADLEKQALEMVYEIAKKVIGESFEASEKALIGMIQQALQSSMGEKLIVLVHPEDFQKIQESEQQLLRVLHGSQTLTLKPAESVKKHSCIIESEMGTLEANLEKQLEAIGKALGVTQDDS